MSELTDFLEARLAEDVITFRLENCAKCLTYQHAPDDPATERFMAEVEAKRAIVALHGPADFTANQYGIPKWSGCATCGTAEEFPTRWPCPTLRLLASVYADHEDYQEGWAL